MLDMTCQKSLLLLGLIPCQSISKAIGFGSSFSGHTRVTDRLADQPVMHVSIPSRLDAGFLLRSFAIISLTGCRYKGCKGLSMSKLFFKGRIDKREEYGRAGFNTKRASKLGTESNPLTLVVNSEERRNEVEALVAEHSLHANITVDDEVAENLAEFDGVLNKPQTQTVEKTPGRNDPCSCGSGKKYKKCCG